MSRVPPGAPARVDPSSPTPSTRSGLHPKPKPKTGPAGRVTRVAPNERIEALLRDLGSKLGSELQPTARERAEHRATGIADVDRMLGGGVPLGALCEVSGPDSSGRTSLVMALLAKTTRAGELVGLVDAADAFDPISAARAGVDLDRVLWVRARNEREALGSSERLIRTEGFPLVVFDWSERLSQHRNQPGRHPGRLVPTATWLRLTRLAAASRTAVLLLSNERLAGSHADIALSMESTGPRFTGTPALLEELETRAVLVRHRTAPIDQAASVLLSRRVTPHESAA